jgi:flavin-dependent dehydrogenase
LARQGRKVLLVDQIDPAHHKVGESLPGAGLRFLRSVEISLENLPIAHQPLFHQPIPGNISVWGAATPIYQDFLRDPDGPGLRLDRGCFEATLRSAAIAAGAVFREAQIGETVRKQNVWQVVIEGQQQVERARWLIDATGRRAVIARRLGAKKIHDPRLTAIYALGRAATKSPTTTRTLIEATESGWWYAATLPSGEITAGFHTDPERASTFSRDRSKWEVAFHETRLISQHYPKIHFDRPLPALDAGGSALDRVTGDGWVACGDAAQAFDPISSQGIFSSMVGGARAGAFVQTMLDHSDASASESATASAAYVSRLNQIRAAYLAHRREAYRSETRWPLSSFWSQQQSD